MAINLNSGQTKVQVNLTLQNPLDLNAAQDALSKSVNQKWKTGAGLLQIDQVFHDSRTLASGANEDLDLNGTALENAFGAAIALLRLKVLFILNTSDDNIITVGGAAANAISTIFGATNDKLVIRAGGVLMLTAPDATGYVITATTADLLNIADDGSASGSATYDIVLAGSTT